MGREFGPWVRHGWCPRCLTTTEQTRWYTRPFDAPPDSADRRVRCNECASEMPWSPTDEDATVA